MNTFLLLIVLTTSTLVLRSGDRIDVDGPVREKDGVVTFRSRGALYSMPLQEVDVEATQKAGETPESVAAEDAEAEAASAAQAREDEVRRLRMSPDERKQKLAELEKNHAGTPPKSQPILDEPPAPKSAEKLAQEKSDEWAWRREARSYEDAVTRAREELELLEKQIEDLRSEIHTFLGLGYKPEQFTYQTTRLERARAELPRARLEVARAERELERFREDARKQGVLPGWLR